MPAFISFCFIVLHGDRSERDRAIDRALTPSIIVELMWARTSLCGWKKREELLFNATNGLLTKFEPDDP